MKMTLFLTTTISGLLTSFVAFAADGVGGVAARSATIDFANARPRTMPATTTAPASLVKALSSTSVARAGMPGAVPGHAGDGRTMPTTVPVTKAAPSSGDDRAPMQFGTRGRPYTTARADASGNATSRYYPYRAAGKLFFNIGANSYICSAALIKRGLVVTAAHCVVDYGKGTGGFFTGWQYIPAYSNGSAPYGRWSARRVWAMNSYIAGQDNCASSGVVCPNDIAVIEVAAQRGVYPGTQTGWFGYAYDGYGFTGSGVSNGNLAQITQIGYPSGLDNGGLMERTDGFGYTSSVDSYNTIIGSQMGGGASGGPWLINFGVKPAVTGSDGVIGLEAISNLVVGTSSWGYTNGSIGIRQMGASPFRSTNIVKLVDTACSNAASSQVCN